MKTIIKYQKKHEKTTTKKVDKKGKGSDKLAKLDRKSSRGMIYENEELRLRTININAEVEKGQYDIKRLRRENEQLRREIWGLRDECDRLNKRFKAKLSEYEKGECNARGNCGNGVNGANVTFLCDGLRFEEVLENVDSDNCEVCKELDRQNRKDQRKLSLSKPLSVVTEELQTNTQKLQPQDLTPEPTTPVDKLANELIDSNSGIPPLSYFENVLHRDSKDFTESTSATSSLCAKACEWEKNLQSPFMRLRRKSRATNSNKTTTDEDIISTVAQCNDSNKSECSFPQLIENVPVVTLSTNQATNSKSTLTNGHPCSTFLSKINKHDPPDLCVTNGLPFTFQTHSDDDQSSYNTMDTQIPNPSSQISDVSYACNCQAFNSMFDCENINIIVQKNIQNKNNLIFNKPVYVTASNRCNLLMTDTTVVTKPLMMVSALQTLPTFSNITALTTNKSMHTKTKVLLLNNKIRFATPYAEAAVSINLLCGV